MTSKLPIIIALIAGTSLGVGAVELLHAPDSSAAICTSPNVQAHSRTVMIMDGHVEPRITSGRLCDTVTITNMDKVSREIAFGSHEAHVAYDGVAEKVLDGGRSFTITLNNVGDVRFHDHTHEEVEGHITVTN